MALNFSSSGSKKRFGLGVGTLKIGAAGATPTTDIGFVRGASLQVTRQKVEVFQGFPRTLVAQYVNQEDVTFSITGIEWNLDRLKEVFAAGVGSDAGLGATGTLAFGGSVTLTEVALEFTHQMPEGGTVVLRIWKAQGQGEAQINFADDIQEFPYSFRALDAATNWANGALTSASRLFQISLTLPT